MSTSKVTWPVSEVETFLQEAIAAAHRSPFSAGGVYRQEVFTGSAFSDGELTRNQDDELDLRLTRSGGKIWQSPSIRSWYRPRAPLGAYALVVGNPGRIIGWMGVCRHRNKFDNQDGAGACAECHRAYTKTGQEIALHE